MASTPTSRMEPLSDPRAVEAWWAESERSATDRDAGNRPALADWETFAGMGFTAYGGLLGILFTFGMVFSGLAAVGVWSHHAEYLPFLLEIDVLTAVGAWLCFDLAESVGFGASVEWDPVSPP